MIWEPAQLTASGRPVLQPGEVEVSLLDKVDVEFNPVGGVAGHQSHAYKNGYAILTNRRVIWVNAGSAADGGSSGSAADTAAPRAASLTLSTLAASNKRVQYGIKGSKVRLVLDVYTNGQRQPVPTWGFHTNIDQVSLRCRGPAPDAFKSLLDEQVKQAVAAGSSSSSSMGVGGTSTAAAASQPGPAGAAAAGPGVSSYMSPLTAGLAARQQQPQAAAAGAGAGAGAGQGPAGTGMAASGLPPPPPPPQHHLTQSRPPPPPPSHQAALRPDPTLLQSMVEMGFPRNRCARSLLAVKNEGLQEALDYMLAFGDQPGMDDPLETHPTPTSGAGAGWGQPQPPQQPLYGAGGGGGAVAAASMRYPSVMPEGYPPPPPPPTSQLPPYAGAPYPGAAPAFNPYGPVPPPPYFPSTYTGGGGGGVSSAPGGSPLHPYGGGAAAVAAPEHLTAAMGSLSLSRGQAPHPHHGSAPDLASSSAAAAAGEGGRPAIGVAGIMMREQQKTEQSGRAVEQAFKDLSALMASAASMVALAEKFRGVLAAGAAEAAAAAGAGAGAGGEDPLLLDLETQQQLIALGISSPVTRETAGARYHTELSRQLADFLEGPLQRCGGMVSLPDVYCLFNRARGTELVSPDDLLQAAKVFSKAGVQGLRLRQLTSGVMVIQGPQHSEERVCAKIAELTSLPASTPTTAAGTGTLAPSAQPFPPLGPGVTAGDVAVALGGISTVIAAEHLLLAEARGVVVRDDGPEGLRFYRNFFRQDRLEPGAMAGYCRAAAAAAGGSGAGAGPAAG
ncbi:hypothetical protein HYH02_000897 [Chlamydomonas schloesseri]|uniref:Vacuolar protein-sorting-associated protein 36 n=1 Tax=Chlamydomonas schloesseri TaxID=2026947 RepID=A0A836BDY2_9CHLO|nr:hypothetical protein HYH02_000897 [Chlamydomonas schloesseri]|eukprot:KAG2455075.1 hypothetical protein HYH02_000897 [Chlamydomonas schloesseri]